MRNALVVFGLALASATVVGAQNLFTNPDFDSEVTPWIEGCGSAPAWLGDDADGCPGSGASTQTSGPCQGFEGAGVGQCIPTAGLGNLFASARVRSNGLFAGVLVLFYENLECTEPNVGQTMSPMFPSDGQWQAVELANFVVPPGAVAALVGFGALSSTALVADIDSAYVGESPLIFRDGFEGDTEGSTLACGWSTSSG
jgi:hypothetical protein